MKIGQVLKGRYRIQAILGEGGMGTVYLAQDTLLDRPRAIKELCPDPLADEARLLAARAQFEREARVLRGLRHKNLPHVSDYFSIDENDYLVMDYIQGESLADLLGRKKRPTERLLYIWLDQILDALEYCHRHHVLHRDVKPANIILTSEGKVMLVDFGLVKFLDPHNPRTATIVRGLGTPEYTPLEQYDASMGHTDARSDIYALGATLYHLLTGRPPRPVSQRILKPDTHPDIRELNPRISAWMSVFVRKAMAVRPENRYQSAGEMRRDLRTQVFKVRRHSTVGSAPLRAPQTVRRQYRHGAHKSAGRSSRRSRTRSGARWLPVLLPIAVPVGVVLFLTVTVTLISLATSSIVTAAVVASPLIFLGLAYYALVSGRRSGPPRI